MSRNSGRVNPPKVAFFLGAGASKAFGYPTTANFVNELKKNLTPEELSILNSMLRLPKVTDIEDVLKILDPIVNPNSTDYLRRFIGKSEIPKNILGHEVEWNKFLDYCEMLKQSVITELFTQYEFNDTTLDKALKYYKRLFSFVESWKQLDIHIFTTNYDSVIENFCTNCEDVELSFGFRTDKRNNRQFWHPEELKQREWKNLGAKKIRLYKLHGSLDWRETAKGRIERVPNIEERISPRTRKYKRNIIIYPAEKDYSGGEPFRRLQKYFDEVLNMHETCLVIGFSFRDPQINNTFLEYLRTKKDNTLIVLSPTATSDVNNNLIRGDKRLAKQISYLNFPFGYAKGELMLLNTLSRKILERK